MDVFLQNTCEKKKKLVEQSTTMTHWETNLK